jgi:hypothetical protein
MGAIVSVSRRARLIVVATTVGLVAALGVVSVDVSAALGQSFGSGGSAAGKFKEPRGIAVDQETGDVYIADRNNNRIDKFNSSGEFLLAWGWGVADGETAALQTCTTTCFGGLGAPFEGHGAGQLTEGEGIAVDNDPLSLSHGDVYLVDAGNHRVQKFGPEGEFILTFGGEVNANTSGNICRAVEAEACQAGVPGTGPGQFEGLGGRSIAVDSAGVVYVGDQNRVQLFNDEGGLESEIALPGAGASQNLAVDSAKDIYLKSSELLGVREYDSTGSELPPPRDEEGLGEALAITIGPADELFVNDLQGEVHHILGFNPAGEQTSSFDRGQLAQSGDRGIAYSEFAKAVYILNAGSVRVVSPPAPGPFILLESQSATEVEPTSATLNATINPEGPEATKYHFEYGTTTAYGESTPEVELTGGPFEDQSVSAPITGLEPRTTYHFRVVAENAAKETSFGPDQTFTTLPPVSIDQTSVSNVNATSARLEAELNPHGVASEYRFEYGISTAYGTNVPIPDGSVGSGSSDTTVENLIQELLPSTTYHYRVVAHNELGTVIGPDRSFTTQGAGSILADDRTWELVSPPNKHGSPLEPITEEGGMVEAAAGGGGMAYVSLGPVNEEPKGVRSPHDTQLLSTRGATGWSTQDITTPHREIALIHGGVPSEYKYFAEDLRASVVEPEGITQLSSQTTERTPYERELSGEFTPLVTASNVPPGTKFGGEETEPGSGAWSNGVEFRTATPDLSRIILMSTQALAAGFGPGFEPAGEPNLYERTGTSLRLVSVLPSGEPTSEAGLGVALGRNNLSMRGAVSSDGGRVVFEVNSGQHLYTRDIALGQTVQLDERQPGAGGGGGKAVFQAASEDGAKVFFTAESQLTVGSTAQPGLPDLYMCEISVSAEGQLSCELSDLSVDHNAGESANVQGEVSAIDASGEHIYFAANGVLTSAPNAHGEVAAPGVCNSAGEATCNLYEYDTVAHQISLVAVLSSKDDPDWAGRTNLAVLGNLTARSSPNGRYYTFMSRRSLTGYDNRDAHSGELDEEVFQFDSQSDGLSCVSCDPTGGRPDGVFDKPSFPGLLVDHPRTWWGSPLAASIPGWTLGPSHLIALYQSRYLSDSGREFFNAADALVPQDTNSVNDVYQYEPPGVGDCTTSSKTYSSASGGCVSLISSGGSQEESAFLDASASGDEAFFLTSSRLVGTDVDAALDVYDAHVCTASSPCPPLPPPPSPACEGDACQNPSSPPNNQTPSSLTYAGPENPPPAAPPTKGKAKPSRGQLLTQALKACKKKKSKRKRLSCERQARKKYGAKKATKAKKRAKGKKASRAGHGRGRGGR